MKLRSLTDERNYFEDPFHSSDMGTFMCSVVSHEHTWVHVKDIDCKCIALDCVNYLVVVPLLHTFM